MLIGDLHDLGPGLQDKQHQITLLETVQLKRWCKRDCDGHLLEWLVGQASYFNFRDHTKKRRCLPASLCLCLCLCLYSSFQGPNRSSWVPVKPRLHMSRSRSLRFLYSISAGVFWCLSNQSLVAAARSATASGEL